MSDLRLLALDEDDLAVISAHCQDAIVKPVDCHWHRDRRQFVIEMNRFVWERAIRPRGLAKLFRRPIYERRRAVLHFDRVNTVQRHGIEQAAADDVLVLLAIRPAEIDGSTVHIDLVFAGGAAIRLGVEVIEAQLSDVGGRWSTQARPDHAEA